MRCSSQECPRKPYSAKYVGGGALVAPPDQYTTHMGVTKPGQRRKLSTGTDLEFPRILVKSVFENHIAPCT